MNKNDKRFTELKKDLSVCIVRNEYSYISGLIHDILDNGLIIRHNFSYYFCYLKDLYFIDYSGGYEIKVNMINLWDW